MRAIVLAAGKGARMRPLTHDVHKSLLPVGSSTILGRIVDGLSGIGVQEIVVVTGYLANQIEDFLSSRYPEKQFRFVYNRQFEDTNNIVSLAMALDSMEFDRDVILIECDLLFKPEILDVLTTLEPGNIALVDRYRSGMDGTVVSVENGIITHVFPTHLQTEGFDYSDKYKTLNIYRFDRDFCRHTFQPLLSCYANTIDSGCYYELVLGMLVNMQRQVVRAEVVEGKHWAEVDDPNDLASAKFIFEPQERTRILSEAWGGHWNFDILDFTFMRNMHFPTDAMVAAMRRALPDLIRNYGSAQHVLNRKLALAINCNSERIQCLNGAAQIYPELKSLLPPGRVLLPSPTFGEYERWLPEHDTYLDAPGIDFNELEKRAGEYAAVFIVSPNNPTGTTLRTSDIYSLAVAHPATMFVVDESFIGFSGEKSLLLRLEIEPLENILVITSLSKLLGVPGLRLGYVYSCDSNLIKRIGSHLPIWNSNSIAEFYIELIVKFRPELLASFENTAKDHDQFTLLLQGNSKIGVVYPSGGNFLLAQIADDAAMSGAQIADQLLQQFSIYAKDVSNKFGCGAWLRFAVRKPEDNRKLAEALAHVLSKEKT